MAMTQEVVTASDMLEIVYISDESFSDSSSDSVSRSNNGIDDIVVADAIINCDSDDEG
jgi:flavin-binding protein dodecin